MSAQTTFAAALLDPALPCPPGMIAWNGSDPARRFAVYRNNVIVSLIDALADSFPVTQELVGEEFFRAMARLYAYARPPISGIMATYGHDFPEFIAGFSPAAGLPYLPDVARLEMLRVEAYHAADASSLTPAQIAELLADSAALPLLHATFQPSLRLLQSSHAVASLWAAHQGVGDLASVVPETPETALVLRLGLDVEIIEIPHAAGTFIASLLNGQNLGIAVASATAVDAHFAPGFILGLLIQKGALTALITEGENHD